MKKLMLLLLLPTITYAGWFSKKIDADTGEGRLSTEMYNSLWNELLSWEQYTIRHHTNPDGSLWAESANDNIYRNGSDIYGHTWRKLTRRSRSAWYEYFFDRMDLSRYTKECSRVAVESDRISRQGATAWQGNGE